MPTWPAASTLELLIRALVILLALLLLSLTIARAAEGPYYVHGTKVNLRSQPLGEVLHQLDEGEKLFVVAREGEWCSVSLPGRNVRGWMHRDYISIPEGSIEAAAAPPPAVEERPRGISRAQSMLPLEGATEVMIEAAAPPIVTAEPEATNAVPTKTGSSSSAASGGAEIRFAANVELTSPARLGDASYKPAGGHQLASISAAQVNLRESPNLNAAVLGKVDAGDRAHVITNNDPWYLVSVPARNLRGWVFGEYVDALPRVEIKADDVRLRETPGLDGRIREQLAKGDIFYKVDQADGWVKVASSASGLAGWVKAEYVRRSEGSVSRPYTVTGDQVNFRAFPAVDSDVIACLPSGATVNVLGRNEKWAYVYFEGHKGWMYSEYLSSDSAGGSRDSGGVYYAGKPRAETVQPNRTLSWKQVGGHSIGGRLLERARAMMGTPYVWGGHNDSGVDCSGLIYKLLLDEGAPAKCLPRRASEQMQGLGLAVDKEELAAGDLVFFTTYKAGPSHVGIYLGDGDFIHASSAQRRVTVSNMSEGYYRTRYVGARRITEEELRQLQ